MRIDLRGKSTESMWKLKLARLTPTTNRAFYFFVHLRTGNLGYYSTDSLNARIIFASYKNFFQYFRTPNSLAGAPELIRHQPQMGLAYRTPWIDNRTEKMQTTHI
jgi:hypothetical protein